MKPFAHVIRKNRRLGSTGLQHEDCVPFADDEHIPVHFDIRKRRLLVHLVNGSIKYPVSILKPHECVNGNDIDVDISTKDTLVYQKKDKKKFIYVDCMLDLYIRYDKHIYN